MFFNFSLIAMIFDHCYIPHASLQQYPKMTLSRFGQAFISYGSYHYNSVNQWIHIICVPIIAATMICALSYIPFHFQIQGQTIGVDTIGITLALVYYFTINIAFGFGMLILMLAMTAGWKFAFTGMAEETFFIWVISIHVIAWIFQFIGHGVFEKRKPALLDNLMQIFNAPLFVLVEIMDKVGLRSKEMEEWNKVIKQQVEEFRKGQSKKE